MTSPTEAGSPGALVSARVPSLSIGLAVYNGEAYLKKAIDSILSQTHDDFELIISDNASTDATSEICREYAARDNRIRYVRNPVNIGGANNENQTFRLARAPYFRWAAHDDVCEPMLFEKMMSVLEQRPDVVLAYTKSRSIDGDGNDIGVSCSQGGTGDTPSQRLRQLSSRYYACEATYGVMRSSVLAKTQLLKNYVSSDRVLLCELAMYGPFVHIDEVLFNKRFHDGNRYKDWVGRMAWFDPGLAATGQMAFPNWLELGGYFAVVRKAKLPPGEKIRSYFYVLRWMAERWKDLTKDVLTNAYMLMRGKRYRTRRYADSEGWS